MKQKTQYGKSILYHYDAQGRLISEEADGTDIISYTYDTFSNRLQKAEGDTTTLYDYDGDNRLVKETTTSQERIETYGYRYDPCGRQTRRERYVLKRVKNPALPAGSMGFARGFVPGGEPPMLETREYDAWGRVARIVRDGTATAYTLRPDGLRGEKTVSRYGAPDQTTLYRWDGEDMAAAEENGTTTHYLRGAALAASETEGRLLYYLHDAHGDITEITDALGNSLASYAYDAFGNEQDPDAEDTNPFRYCGEYWDIHTNALYLRARDYKPRIGRFLSQDSAKDGLNWYVYCGNNPIKFIDPSGNSYEYVNKGKVTRGKYDYHEIEITIDAKSLLSTHTFYIRDKEDVIRFYNDEENTDLAFRSKDLAEGMFAAFKDIKGYELSGRTIGGIHSELVLHDALYRKGYKLESTTEADMGTPRFKYFSGRIPFLPTGNDYDAWRFEVLQSDSDMAIAKWGINSIFEAQRKMKESLSQMQQFKNDLGYFLSNDYFKYKLLDNLNKYHR